MATTFKTTNNSTAFWAGFSPVTASIVFPERRSAAAASQEPTNAGWGLAWRALARFNACASFLSAVSGSFQR